MFEPIKNVYENKTAFLNNSEILHDKENKYTQWWDMNTNIFRLDKMVFDFQNVFEGTQMEIMEFRYIIVNLFLFFTEMVFRFSVANNSIAG